MFNTLSHLGTRVLSILHLCMPFCCIHIQVKGSLDMEFCVIVFSFTTLGAASLLHTIQDCIGEGEVKSSFAFFFNILLLVIPWIIVEMLLLILEFENYSEIFYFCIFSCYSHFFSIGNALFYYLLIIISS